MLNTQSINLTQLESYIMCLWKNCFTLYSVLQK
jgi:hypothetical protein